MQLILDTLMHGPKWNVVGVAHVVWVDQSSLVIIEHLASVGNKNRLLMLLE